MDMVDLDKREIAQRALIAPLAIVASAAIATNARVFRSRLMDPLPLMVSTFKNPENGLSVKIEMDSDGYSEIQVSAHFAYQFTKYDPSNEWHRNSVTHLLVVEA